MAKTILGRFESVGSAQAAVRELAESGIAQEDIGFMADQGHELPGTAQLNESEGMDGTASFVISVAADDARAALACEVLSRHGAADIDQRDADRKKQGWKGRFEA
jgi:hypothetical protein